jgi:phage antirepressor YoqD-like protein
MKIETTNGGTPAISSLEIARITGKPHNDVLKDVRRILEEAEINLGEFSQVYKAGNGQAQPCFILPRRECDLVMSGYSVKYRLAIIDRWHELEAKIAHAPMALPTHSEALRGWAAELERNEIQAAQIAIAAPKVAAHNRLLAADGSECISSAAKILGVAPNELFTSLSETGWIFRRAGSWVAYQAAITSGMMAEKLHTVIKADGTERICAQARVTAKGIAELASYFETN